MIDRKPRDLDESENFNDQATLNHDDIFNQFRIPNPKISLIKYAIKPETSFSLKNLAQTEGPVKSKEILAYAQDLTLNEMLYNCHG